MINSVLFIGYVPVVIIAISAVFIIGFAALIIKWYKKPIHGKALVRSGQGGTKIVFEKGFFVIPVLHRLEVMDITLKTIDISRIGVDGLICKDNVRADIKVTFFVRVNNTFEHAKDVALSIGCERASAKETLENLFEAKFSEALKTVGKRFDFVDLYNERDEFRRQIVALIGKNLNGYLFDDCAIDYLEQTPLESMKERNILDAEGIKKIIELTSTQQIKANLIEREKEKTIKKQDVEAREIILTYERQLAQKEETQKREIANIKDKEAAETIKVAQEQLEISEKSKIASLEAIEVAQQRKEKEVIVALWDKEKVNAVEQEIMEREKMLELTKREKIVALAEIEKNKEIELEKAKIQEIIRERVKVQKDVVVEEQKIKDTEEFATAERKKRVAIINAEEIAEQALVKQIKNAEANRTSTQINGEAQKISAEFNAKQKIIEAETSFAAAGKESEAIKTLAEAEAAKESALGKAEAQVIEAKAAAMLKDGETEAKILEMKAIAEAKGVEAKAKAKAQEVTLVTTAEANALLQTGQAEAKVIEQKGLAEAGALFQKGEAEANVLKQKGLSEADILKQKGLSEAEIITSKALANEKQGLAEAKIIQEKLSAEAKGIDDKAAAMKKLDGVGKDHEEFKLQLQKDKEVEIAQINIHAAIADAQAKVIAEALKSAKIDIVGGETMFFEKIIGSITRGKNIDTLFDNSQVLASVKDKFIPEKSLKKQTVEKDSNSENLIENKVKSVIEKYQLLIDGFKDMTIQEALENLLTKMVDNDTKNYIKGLIISTKDEGIAQTIVKTLGF
ncbi:MAG: hypothetical protein JXR68_05330 [Bacteroidales bacterium]|nr:hypothetical protein [Bacteroidales bacterium]